MSFGIILCLIGLVHGVFKYFVIRDVARDVFRGGGVPIIDFVIWVPIWFSFGLSIVLVDIDLYPFPFFAVVIYVGLAAGLYGLMQLEFKLGKPEVERQLTEIRERSSAERSAATDADEPRC